MKNIHTDFHNAKTNSVLFLGRFTSLSEEEIKLFLEKFDIHYTTTLDHTVKMVIESSILSPLEEEIATTAYQQKIPIYNNEQFDKLYADELNSDSILMSLKLSNNQERLARLLHNQYLSDALFIKLFAMYDWGGEGMFDNSENMKIATLFAKRFFSKSRFDAATYHSPVSVFEVAILSKNPDLLEVMFDLPEIEVKQSRSGIKKPTTTRQALAANVHANKSTLTKLFRRNDKDIDFFLALNPALAHTMLEQLFERADRQTKEALAQNENLSPSLFEKLTQYPTLWQFQKIDLAKLTLLPSPIPPQIGENENLSPEVIDFLLSQNNLKILENLAINPALSSAHIQKLYALQDETLYPLLCANPSTPQEILETLFQKNDHEIERHLALNPNTPTIILEKLFAKDDFEINCSLALNETLPVSWLQQLQIDTRLLNYLKENKTFTENILNNLGI